jgi:hypothetical protein
MEEKHVKYEAENMVVKNFFWQWVLPFRFDCDLEIGVLARVPDGARKWGL